MNRLPPGPPAPQLPPTVTGSVDRMPCPHCGHSNDFRELDNQQCLDTGHEMSCDRCHRMMVITGIRVVKIMQARAIRDGVVRRPALGPAQSTTISYEQLKRLK